MSVPKHLWRFPTGEAIANLASRFGLSNNSSMQDWEYEVADVERIDEFLEAYEGVVLTDDERFVLMEMIIQSFDDLEGDLDTDPRWSQVIDALENNIDIHIYTVWYWSGTDTESEMECWHVTPYIRPILDRHKSKHAVTSQDAAHSDVR